MLGSRDEPNRCKTSALFAWKPGVGPAPFSGGFSDPFFLFSRWITTQDQSAPAQRQNLETAGPRVRIVRLPDDAGNVEQQEEKGKDRYQESRPHPRLLSERYCSSAGNEDS